MKALAVLILLTLAVSAFGQKVKWEKREAGDPKYAALYILDYPLTGCMVYTKKDNSGVYVEAYNALGIPPGGPATQRTVIDIDKGTIACRHESQSKIGGEWTPAEAPKGSFSFLPPDVFSRTCAYEARKLPRSVKALFFGYYGLGKKAKK